jgi:hypothetical protein
MRPQYSLVTLCILCLFLGCADGPQIEKGVTVRGKVLKAGAPIPGVRPEVGVGVVQITLLPVNPTSPSGFSLVKADGSFEILGDGKGIPPGKYKVVIVQRDQLPDQPSAVPDSFSETNSTMQVEIPADKVGGTYDLGTIDIDKPAGS